MIPGRPILVLIILLRGNRVHAFRGMAEEIDERTILHTSTHHAESVVVKVREMDLYYIGLGLALLFSGWWWVRWRKDVSDDDTRRDSARVSGGLDCKSQASGNGTRQIRTISMVRKVCTRFRKVAKANTLDGAARHPLDSLLRQIAGHVAAPNRYMADGKAIHTSHERAVVRWHFAGRKLKKLRPRSQTDVALAEFMAGVRLRHIEKEALLQKRPRFITCGGSRRRSDEIFRGADAELRAKILRIHKQISRESDFLDIAAAMSCHDVTMKELSETMKEFSEKDWSGDAAPP